VQLISQDGRGGRELTRRMVKADSLVSPVGSGKTALLLALCRGFRDNYNIGLYLSAFTSPTCVSLQFCLFMIEPWTSG
jgi:hypothetical protein